MNALIPIVALALVGATPATKKKAPPVPAPAAEQTAPTTSGGRGPQLRVIKLDPQRAKAVYKVNAAPGLATVIQLPESWTTTPTCGDCVFGDAKAETQLWRLDVFPETHSLSIKPTRVPGADAPPSAFVTNIDVALDGGIAVTLFVELTLPESADARVEFTVPEAERADAKLSRRERELEGRFEERLKQRSNERMLEAFMRGAACKDFFGRPNRKDNVVVRLKQICKTGGLVLVSFEVENRRRDDIVVDRSVLEATKGAPTAGDKLEKTELRFNERGLGVAAIESPGAAAPERYRLTVTIAGVDEETQVVIEDIEL